MSFRTVLSRYDGFARNCKNCEKTAQIKYVPKNKRAFLVKFNKNKYDILKTRFIKLPIIVLPWKKHPTKERAVLIKSEARIICRDLAKRKILNEKKERLQTNQKIRKISDFREIGIEICIYRRKISNKQYVAYYLKTHHCVDCGESNAIVLDFDHVRGKKICNISNLTKNKSGLGRLKAEIEKCEVRCSNCHRIATYQRRINKT